MGGESTPSGCAFCRTSAAASADTRKKVAIDPNEFLVAAVSTSLAVCCVHVTRRTRGSGCPSSHSGAEVIAPSR